MSENLADSQGNKAVRYGDFFVNNDAYAVWRTKVFGVGAIVYSTLLTMALSLRFAHHFGDFAYEIAAGNMDYINYYQDGWSFLYYFTWQSNMFIVIWLFIYGWVRLWNGQSLFARFVTHGILFNALALATTLLFMYGVVFIVPYFITDGFHIRRHLHTPFVYFLTPIVIWMIFLFDRRRNYPRMTDSIYVMAYPIMYIGVSMIIGHLVDWSDIYMFDPELNQIITIPGGRAFPYPQFDPANYPNIAVFIVALFMFLAGIFGWSLTLVKIERWRWRRWNGIPPSEPEKQLAPDISVDNPTSIS